MMYDKNDENNLESNRSENMQCEEGTPVPEIPSLLTEEERNLLKLNPIVYEDEEDGEENDTLEVQDKEDLWEGEDPSEFEVERFCQPKETVLLDGLSLHLRQRRVVIYPLKLSDLGHPVFLECIEKSCSFQTHFIQSRRVYPEPDTSWTGLVDIIFKTSTEAKDSLDGLKLIREDVIVKAFDMNEPAAKKFIQQWMKSNATVKSLIPSTLKNLIIVKNIPDEIQYEDVKEAFPKANDVIITSNKRKTYEKNQLLRSGFVFFDAEEDVNDIDNNYTKPQKPFIIKGVKLKVIPYQKPDFPGGLLRMKRRYRIMCQIRGLKAILKDESVSKDFTEYQINKVNTVITSCRDHILSDNRIRQRLGLPLHTYAYLRSIPSIRESISKDYEWLNTVSGFFDVEKDKKEESVGSGGRGGGGGGGGGGDSYGVGVGSAKKKSGKNRKWTKPGFVPTRRENRNNNKPPYKFNQNISRHVDPIARVQEIANKIARIASEVGYQSLDNPQLMRLDSMMNSIGGINALKGGLPHGIGGFNKSEAGLLGPGGLAAEGAGGAGIPDLNHGVNPGLKPDGNVIPVISLKEGFNTKWDGNKRGASSWQVSKRSYNQAQSYSSPPHQPQAPSQPPQQQQQSAYGYPDNSANYSGSQINYGFQSQSYSYPNYGGYQQQGSLSSNPQTNPQPLNKSGWGQSYPLWGNNK